jgi:hypothetical protein
MNTKCIDFRLKNGIVRRVWLMPRSHSIGEQKRRRSSVKSPRTNMSRLVQEVTKTLDRKIERKKRDTKVANACRNYRDFNKSFSAEWARFETRIE